MPSRGRRWDKLRKQVLSEESRCLVRGDSDELEVDHIAPTSRGGGDVRENLQALCRKHNAEEGAMLPSEQALWQEEDQLWREAIFERLDREYREGLGLTPYHPDL